MSDESFGLIVVCILVVYGFILWNLSWRISQGIEFVRSLTQSEIASMELRLKREMMSATDKGTGFSAADGIRQSTRNAPRENVKSPDPSKDLSPTSGLGLGVTMEISKSGSSMDRIVSGREPG